MDQYSKRLEEMLASLEELVERYDEMVLKVMMKLWIR